MKNTLLKISRYAGMREDLIQAAGGNTSIKISDTEMLIKASGYQLTEITNDNGYTMVNYALIKDYFYNHNLDDIVKEDEKKLLTDSFIRGERPSIETFLHSITYKITLHTHPVLVNILLTRTGGLEMLSQMFPEALIVGYATPGIELAKKYFKAFQESNKKAEIIFLKNHGLIISGDSYEYVRQLTEQVIHMIAIKLNINDDKWRNSSLIYDAINSAGINNKIVYLTNNINIYDAYKNNKFNTWNHTFCPDTIVYCGKKVLELDNDLNIDHINNFIVNYGEPIIILYLDYFYIVAETIKKAKEIESLFSFSAEIISNNINNKIDFLSENEQDFLLNWDAEKYRKNMK